MVPTSTTATSTAATITSITTPTSTNASINIVRDALRSSMRILLHPHSGRTITLVTNSIMNITLMASTTSTATTTTTTTTTTISLTAAATALTIPCAPPNILVATGSGHDGDCDSGDGFLMVSFARRFHVRISLLVGRWICLCGP